MSARRGLVLAALGLLVLALAAILIWRDDIVEAFLDPKIPYAVYKPPPGVAYAKPFGLGGVAERFRRTPGRPRLLHRPHHLRRRAGLERS